MHHKKDLYFVTTPSPIPWYCEIGGKLKLIPGDNYYRVFSLAVGEHYACVCMEPAHPYYLNSAGELSKRDA